MELNKGLNLTNNKEIAISGELAYAKNIVLDNTFTVIENEYGFDENNIYNTDSLCGKIELDSNNQILFHRLIRNSVSISCISVIDTNTFNITKRILVPQLNFTKTNPIRGTYNYNENGDLIIIFSDGVNGSIEDKVLNIDKFNYTLVDSVLEYSLSTSDIYLSDLTPNVQYPKINSSIIDGNLNTGSYQIAICYYVDKTYTNYSLLSLPVFIYGDIDVDEPNKLGLKPGSISNKGIEFTFQDLDSHYDYYKVSVLYNDGTTFIVRNSELISKNKTKFIIKDISKLATSNLDNLLINSIFYSNSESFSVVDNVLYRANLKSKYDSEFDALAQAIADNVTLNLKSTEILDIANIKNKQYIKFQNDEAYALYLTFGDKKGNVIGSYPIRTLNYSSQINVDVPRENNSYSVYHNELDNLLEITTSQNVSEDTKIIINVTWTIAGIPPSFSYSRYEGYIYAGSNAVSFDCSDKIGWTFYGTTNITFNPILGGKATIRKNYYLINKEADILQKPFGARYGYTTNTIEVTLPNLSTNFKNRIGFWCIHRAQRTNHNSRIYTQAISMAQPRIGIGFIPNVESLRRENMLVYTNPQKISQGYNGGADYYKGYDLDGNMFKSITSLKEIRVYSFEDNYNKFDNFPNTKMEVISIIKYPMQTPSETSLNNKYSIDLNYYEQVYQTELDIVKNIFREGDNITVLNALIESGRVLTVENNTLYNLPDNLATNRTYQHRVNILNEVSEFYEDLYDQTLVLCSTIYLPTNNKAICYGDTFYSEFMFIAKRLYNTKYEYTFATTNTNYWGIEDYYANNNEAFIKDRICTFKLTALVESKYNIHARYWDMSYPKWDQPINTSEQIGYDSVYHTQNTQNLVEAVDLNNIVDNRTNRFPYRIARSLPLSKESNGLQFRKFLALDYYDMPYNRKEIVAIVSTYKNMYIQQKKSLSVATIKDVISYDEGTTYIGTGQLFDRLPTEVIPTKDGYISCQSYFNIGLIDIGLWVIDNEASRIFLISDTDAKIITDNKNKDFFINKLTTTNPYLNKGGYICYDDYSKRLILVTANETMSYSLAAKNWLSFHTYSPNISFNSENSPVFISHDDISKIMTISKFNTNKKISSESVISVIFNDEPKMYKRINAIGIDSRFKLNGVSQYDRTFNYIMIHNDSQCTGYKELDNTTEWLDRVKSAYINDMFWFNDINDIVLNNKLSFIQNYVEIISGNVNLDSDWFDKSKIISTFAVITLKFDNYYYNINNSKLPYGAGGFSRPIVQLQNLNVIFDKHDR